MTLLKVIVLIQRAVSRTVARIEEVFGAICIVVITGFIFTQVVYRNLGFSVSWLEEAAQYIFVVFVFIMAGLTTRRREHLFVEVLQHLMGNRLSTRVVNLAIQLLCLIMIGVFVYVSYLYMIDAWERPGYAPASGFHLGWPKSAPFAGGVLILGHYVALVINDVSKLKREFLQGRS